MLDWTRLERHGNARLAFEDLAFAVTERRYRNGREGKLTRVEDRGGGHGVEFYVERPDGEIWGWQTKWFYPDARLDGKGRKAQIQESLARAVRATPRVSRFILWTPEPFTPGEQTWFKSTLRTSTYKRKPVVPDGYLVDLVHEHGGHIESRLAEPAYAGLRAYFFGELDLTPEWYRRRFTRSARAAGDAYRPDVHTATVVEDRAALVLHSDRGTEIVAAHVERALNLASDLDPVLTALSVTEVRAASAALDGDAALEAEVRAAAPDLATAAAVYVRALCALVDPARPALWDQDSADRVAAARVGIDRASQPLSDIMAQYQSALWPQSVSNGAGPDAPPSVQRFRDALVDASGLIDTLVNYAGMLEVDLNRSQKSYLHVLGDAGAGKSHLAFHLVDERLNAQAPAVLLLGREFTSPDALWDQLRRLIDVPPDLSQHGTLAVLSADATRRGVRLPIVIDGLNEAVVGGQMSDVWTNGLAAFAAEVGSHPGLVLITTTRTSYTPLIWPDGAPPHTVQTEGFGPDAEAAAARYFQAYGIEPADSGALPEMFRLPLFLRLFCESFEPNARPHQVYLGEQSQLKTIERFLDRAGTRIGSRLRGRVSAVPVREAVDRLALALWTGDARSVPLSDAVRATDDQPLGALDWQMSYAGALESEGLFISRDAGATGEVLFFTYDLVAGYVVARALLKRAGGDAASLLAQPDVERRLFGDVAPQQTPPQQTVPPTAAPRRPRAMVWRRMPGDRSRSWSSRRHVARQVAQPVTAGPLPSDPVSSARRDLHPLATDIRRVLAALLLSERGTLLHEVCSHPDAVRVSLDSLFEVNPDAVPARAADWLVEQWDVTPELRPYLLSRAQSVWNVPGHPLGAAFWSDRLFALSVAERDLAWSEHVRHHADAIEAEAAALEATARSVGPLAAAEAERLVPRLQRLAWALTTTIRPLRDRITRALYYAARRCPEAYTTLLGWSLGVNDPYVPERVVAAAYGAAMALAFGPGAGSFRAGTFAEWAGLLCGAFFAADARHRTTHVLLRDYAASLVELAVATGTVDAETLGPEAAWRGPYPPQADWAETDARAQDSYPGPITYVSTSKVLDHLIDGHPRSEEERDRILRQLYTRVFCLGYSAPRFVSLEERMGSRYDHAPYDGPRGAEPGTVDLYSAKYVRIATFELVGHRTDLGLLTHDERYHDVDLDPSFPDPPRDAAPIQWNGIGDPTADTADWVASGGVQDVEPALSLQTVDGVDGPWTLLHAYTDETDFGLRRRRHTDVLAVLLGPEDVGHLERFHVGRASRSGWGLGDLPGLLYLFAGEAPWHPRFPSGEESLQVETGRTVPTGGTHLSVHVWRDGEELDEEDALNLLVEAAEGMADDATLADAEARLQAQGFRAEIADVEETEPEHHAFNVVVPAYQSNWEGYHSSLTDNGWGMCPTGRLCLALGLHGAPQTFDVFGADGQRASVHFRHDEDSAYVNTQRGLYLRTDLLDRFLDETGLALVWLVSTERTWDYKTYNAHSYPAEAEAYASEYRILRCPDPASRTRSGS